MTKKSALISGAGIAGSTAAFWLARAGWEVTVVEKADAIRSSGNPIDVRGEAAVVAHEMGVWPVLRSAATSVERLAFVDAAGRPAVVVDTRSSASPDEELEVPRADLAAALLGAARDRAELIVGDAITGIEQDGAGADVRFEKGSPRRFDLVIGADGLHSGVRRIVFGPEQDFASPFGMFVGTLHTHVDVPDPHLLRLYNRPGISLSIHPGVSDPLAALIFRSSASYDRHDAEARKRLVRDAYSGKGWVSDAVVAEWEETDDVYFDAVTRITMPTWTKNRVTLLGDAADCISLLGEGSSNAIVGAKTLADALDSSPASPAAGLAAYERAHRSRIRVFQRKARSNSRFLVPSTRSGLALRNLAVRIGSRFGGASH